MFIDKENKKDVAYYENILESIGTLSKLFSDNSAPYIPYRVAENAFCEAFEAENLSRSDCSADASKNNIGIGIKTFLNSSGASLQKIAEFNKESSNIRDLKGIDLIKYVSKLRNDRLSFTKRLHKLDSLIYHCTVRENGKILIYETNMDYINIDKIKILNSKELFFKDDIHEYNFNISKSTLYRRFITKNILSTICVEISDDPYKQLIKLLSYKKLFCRSTKRVDKNNKLNFINIIDEESEENLESIYLPLYATKNKVKYVPERSGLNQWNANGRIRNIGEVYIPIPAWIHKNFPNFFPHDTTNQNINIPFNLKLPNGKMLSVKVCQQGGKALMSNPNRELGEWLLRDVLALIDGELLTYEKLLELNVDSVVISKDKNNNYSINFKKLNSYDDFENQFKK